MSPPSCRAVDAKCCEVARHPAACYLRHVDEAQRQRLVAQDGSVLVSLPSLQHDLKLVGVPLQEMWVLRAEDTTHASARALCLNLLGAARGALPALHECNSSIAPKLGLPRLARASSCIKQQKIV